MDNNTVKRLNVSSAPHVRSELTTRSIMGDVCIALIPASLFGIYNFGYRALLIILTSIVACVLTEYIYQKCMKLPVTTSDMSAVLTGLLLALNLPVTVPLWMPVIGGVFAIIIVKQLFGGLGRNFMNPALAARCFLLISFAGPMTNFAVEKVENLALSGYWRYGMVAVDGVSGATPLAMLKSGENVNLLKMFLGVTGGTIGETSVIAILGGALYLLARKVISIRIPLTYIATFSVIVLIYGMAEGKGFDINYLAAHLCGGGLMLGAFFMATDYVTSPITPNGKIVFGILLGILTAVFRLYGGSAEGVSYAIICGNMLVPLIEKFTMPVPFGRGRVHNG